MLSRTPEQKRWAVAVLAVQSLAIIAMTSAIIAIIHHSDMSHAQKSWWCSLGGLILGWEAAVAYYRFLMVWRG